MKKQQAAKSKLTPREVWKLYFDAKRRIRELETIVDLQRKYIELSEGHKLHG